jgi:predicted transposase YdaD
MSTVTRKSDNCQLLEMLVFCVIWVAKKGRETQIQIQMQIQMQKKTVVIQKIKDRD